MEMELKDYQRRFLALPILEQQRLLNLVKYMNDGHKLNESLLAGFTQESKDILADMLQARFPWLGEVEGDTN